MLSFCYVVFVQYELDVIPCIIFSSLLLLLINCYLFSLGTRRLLLISTTSLQECLKLQVDRILNPPHLTSPAAVAAQELPPRRDERPDGVRREPVAGPCLERGAAAAPALRRYACRGRCNIAGRLTCRPLRQMLAEPSRCG